MVELSISVPERDLLEFRRVLALMQTQALKTPEKAVEMGAVFVAKALQASTAVSPKQRKVVKASEEITRKGNRWARSGYSQWAVLDDADKSNLHFIPIAGHYKTMQEAKATVEQKFLRIRQRGLARLLWWKAVAKIAVAKAGRHPETAGGQDRIADRLLRVEQRGGPDAMVRMSNSANYALKAFKSNGRAVVDTAMRRAANNMRKYVERQTGLKFAEKNVA